MGKICGEGEAKASDAPEAAALAIVAIDGAL